MWHVLLSHAVEVVLEVDFLDPFSHKRLEFSRLIVQKKILNLRTVTETIAAVSSHLGMVMTSIGTKRDFAIARLLHRLGVGLLSHLLRCQFGRRSLFMLLNLR